MTRDDIIKAAFKVWGRDFYRTTSLTEIARELKVSKPALYRHFRDKDALLEAMNAAYFDNCAAFIKSGFEKVAKTSSCKEAYLIFIRTISEYYIRNEEDFIFSLIRVYNSHDRQHVTQEFHNRGIYFEHLVHEKNEAAFYPPTLQLVIATLIFCVANFHRRNLLAGVLPSDEMMRAALAGIEDRIEKGFKLDVRGADTLNYEALEKQASGTVYEDTEDNALLRAVAEAVAEAGPWDASMEMVAKRSGLSKSGLYAHFKNKQDMLGKLFITELVRILGFAKAQIETSQQPEEQLYLAIITIVNYLRSRPEILVAIDWIKTRRLDLGKGVSGQIFRIIGSIKMEAIQKYDPHILVEYAQYILYMIVNVLAWWPPGKGDLPPPVHGYSKAWARNLAEIPNESFRVLFRFVALGLEGLNDVNHILHN